MLQRKIIDDTGIWIFGASVRFNVTDRATGNGCVGLWDFSRAQERRLRTGTGAVESPD